MTPDQFRTVISRVLIVGVSVSAALIALGFIASLAVGWSGSLIGAPGTTDPRTDFGALGRNLLAARPIGLAQAGLAILVATPVLRVVASVFGFILEGDRLYAAITLIVLGILLASLFILH